jgi:hypothetical protein
VQLTYEELSKAELVALFDLGSETFFVLGDTRRSASPVAIPNMKFPVDGAFLGTSYLERYGILCERLMREPLYDSE